MSHIFISYSRDDLAFARYLRALLSQEGFSVWMDERGLSAGMNWWKEIERNIDHCAAFLVIMSPSSDESMYVNNEILRALDQKKTLFPVLLSGQPFSLLASVQYEDLRAGLNAKLPQRFISNLREVLGTVTERRFRFEIVEGDVREIACDVLVLKYAKEFFGASLAVAVGMLKHGALQTEKMPQQDGDYTLVTSQASVMPTNVLFLGTKTLSNFGYREMRTFSEHALNILATELADAKHIAFTIHGPGYGLDEDEALLAQVGGIVDALQSDRFPQSLEQISIVEIDKQRVKRLREAVTPFFDEVSYAQAVEDKDWAYDLIFSSRMPEVVPDAGTEDVKPYALAIMPDDDSLEDIYYYGIRRPVHSQGLLCERMTFGEKPQGTEEKNGLQTTLQRAGQASLLICHLSEQTPLLSLHVGYAWGKGVPVIFIGRDEKAVFYEEEVLLYEKIWELEERLGQQLASYEE